MFVEGKHFLFQYRVHECSVSPLPFFRVFEHLPIFRATKKNDAITTADTETLFGYTDRRNRLLFSYSMFAIKTMRYQPEVLPDDALATSLLVVVLTTTYQGKISNEYHFNGTTP